MIILDDRFNERFVVMNEIKRRRGDSGGGNSVSGSRRNERDSKLEIFQIGTKKTRLRTYRDVIKYVNVKNRGRGRAHARPHMFMYASVRAWG